MHVHVYIARALYCNKKIRESRRWKRGRLVEE